MDDRQNLQAEAGKELKQWMSKWSQYLTNIEVHGILTTVSTTVMYTHFKCLEQSKCEK